MYKRSCFFIAAICLVLLLPVSGYAKSKLLVEQDEFIVVFNEFALEHGLPLLNETPDKTASGPQAIAHTHKLGEYLIVQFYFRPSDNALFRIIFIGSGDGTDQSVRDLVNCASSVIGASVPADVRVILQESLTYSIGIWPLKVMDGKTRSLPYSGVKYTSVFRDSTGLIVAIEKVD